MPTEKRQRQKEGRRQRLEAERKASKRRQLTRRSVTIVVIAAVVVTTVFLLTRNSKSTTTTTAPQTAAQARQAALNQAAVHHGCPADPTAPSTTKTWSKAPAMTINTSAAYSALFKTDAGTFKATLDASTAPKTVNNFVFLARQGFYDCATFYRVIPGFMNQGGDPAALTGTVGPGYTIPDEYPPAAANSKHQYPLGSLAMANSSRPHTGGSGFFVVAGPEGEALPNTYSMFGQVTSGMKTVERINRRGNPNPQSNGVPPVITYRIYSITIIGPS